MYKNEFEKSINSGNRFNAYMFYGQSEFLIEKYSQDIAKLHAQGEDITKIYYDDYDFKYCKNLLLQSSLFASKNVLLIKRDKKIEKKEVLALIEACNTNPDSTVIFACMGDGDFKTMANSFSNKNKSVNVRLFAPFPQEALAILENEAKKLDIRYEVSALNHLYFMHRNDLTLCVNDLKKLAIIDEESISSKVVELHCFGIGNVSLEDFLHKLFSGQNIKKDLYFILEEGINIIYLLNQISSFAHQLFMISSYARTMGEPNAKEILGFMPPKAVWEKKSRLAINIKPEKFLEIFEFLESLELDLKSSKIPDQNAYLQASLRKLSEKFS